MFENVFCRVGATVLTAVLVAAVSIAQETADQSPPTGLQAGSAGAPEVTAPAPPAKGASVTAGDRMVEEKSRAAFRYVPPGSWTMGSPLDEPGRGDIEHPHEVTLTRGFWIGETEVTQEQWNALMDTDPSRFVACGPTCPVESMTWYEAVAFCNAFSRSAGLDECYPEKGGTMVFAGLDCNGYRLPSEAEWEWAARAGTRTPLYTGDLTIVGPGNGPELDAIAWYGGNSGVQYEGGFDCSGWKGTHHPATTCGTHPVGEKKANPWGLYDMLGNVWEWTFDGTGSYPQQPLVDPVAGFTSNGRVVRGCAWDSAAAACRAANRGMNTPNARSSGIGLRLARTAAPVAEAAN